MVFSVSLGILDWRFFDMLNRFIAIEIDLGPGQYQLLRSKNSISTIRKTKLAASKWIRISSLCFWDAKCARVRSLRFLICLRVVAVATSPVSFLAVLLACTFEALYAFARYVLLVSLYFDFFLEIIIGIYVLFIFRARHVTKEI